MDQSVNPPRVYLTSSFREGAEPTQTTEPAAQQAVVGWGGFSLVMESLLFRGLKNGVRSRPDAVSRIQFKVGIERGSILKKVKKSQKIQWLLLITTDITGE